MFLLISRVFTEKAYNWKSGQNPARICWKNGQNRPKTCWKNGHAQNIILIRRSLYGAKNNLKIA